MRAAKTGIIAEFEDGYLQREIRIEATVAGGIDAGLRKPTDIGYGAGRLVTVGPAVAGVRPITAAADVTASSIGKATHIIAQTDDTVRSLPEDFNYTERFTTVPNLVVKNSTVSKTVAVYQIVNVNDIKLIDLG